MAPAEPWLGAVWRWGRAPLRPALLGSVQHSHWLEQLVNEAAQKQLPGQPKAKGVSVGDAA